MKEKPATEKIMEAVPDKAAQKENNRRAAAQIESFLKTREKWLSMARALSEAQAFPGDSSAKKLENG